MKWRPLHESTAPIEAGSSSAEKPRKDRPARRSDQVAPDRIRNARKRDEQMRGFVLAAQIVERERERVFHQAADFQAPAVFFNLRRSCVDVNPVVLFERRELRARAWRGFNFGSGVWQGVIGRPSFTLYDFSLAPADNEGADNRADYSDDVG